MIKNDNTYYPYNLIFNVVANRGSVNHDILDGVEAALNTLTKREREVIFEYFANGRTYESIAKDYGIGKERIRQIVASAIRKLNSPSRFPYLIYGLQGKLLKDQAEQKARTIAALERDIELAKGLLESYKNDSLHQMASNVDLGDSVDTEILTTDICKLNLSFRSFNCLRRGNCNTIYETILAIQDGRMVHFRNLGRKSYNEIIYKISQFTKLTEAQILGMEGEKNA